MKKAKDISRLNPREIDILYILWEAKKPLLASEMATDDVPLATVHTTLKRMREKELVKVVDFAKSGNVFGRCYLPTITIEEYLLETLIADFSNRKCKKITLAMLLENLYKDMDANTLQKELDELDRIIKMEREKIAKREE